MKDKREMIERALKSVKQAMHSKLELLGADWGELHFGRKAFNVALDALAKQAIAIGAEIIQGDTLVSGEPITEIHLNIDDLDEYSETYIIVPDHPLAGGKAIAIILSLEEEDGATR